MIVLIDDSSIILEMLKISLSGEQIASFESMSEFLASNVSRETCSVIVTDWQLPDSEDPVKSVKTANVAPVVLISGATQQKLDDATFEFEPEFRISKDAGLPAITELILSIVRA